MLDVGLPNQCLACPNIFPLRHWIRHSIRFRRVQSNAASTFDWNPLLHDNAIKTKTEKIAVDRSTFEEISNAFLTSIRSIKQAPTTAVTQQRTNQSLTPWKRFRQALQTSKESTRNSIQTQLCNDHQRNVIQIFDNTFGILCETYNTSRRQRHCRLNRYLHGFGIKNTPYCTCRYGKETVEHYLLECRNYAEQRKKLRREVGTGKMRVEILLGDPKMIKNTLDTSKKQAD